MLFIILVAVIAIVPILSPPHIGTPPVVVASRSICSAPCGTSTWVHACTSESWVLTQSDGSVLESRTDFKLNGWIGKLCRRGGARVMMWYFGHMFGDSENLPGPL